MKSLDPLCRVASEKCINLLIFIVLLYQLKIVLSYTNTLTVQNQ